MATTPPSKIQLFSTIVIALGFALLLSIPIRVALFPIQRASVEALTVPTISSAFEENPGIPVEEFRAKFNDSVILLDSYRHSYQQLRNAQQCADWISFTLTSLITVVAGYIGRSRMVQSDVSQPSSRSLEGIGDDGATPYSSPVDQFALRAARRSKRLVAFIGVIAALASISTGVSNRLDADAEKRWKQAADLSQNLSTVRIEWFNAKNREEALRVIGKLDTYNFTY